MAEQSFGWRQPVAALIALASAVGPLIAAVGWMIGGADGPLERRDPTQVPAFVAEESRTRDQARTLVLDSDSAAHVSYMLVRGSGARLGDGEVAAGDGGNSHLDKTVANLVAGSGADQADQLGGFAVRYVLVHKGAPREVTRVLDATPGLSRLSQQDGSGLWRVDQEVARATIVSGEGSGAGEPQPVAAGPVEIHTEVPSGSEGRVLRLADTAAEGWTATLDGKPLTRTTVDGWAQGFELPASGGKLDVTYDTPFTHTAWLWAQGLLGVFLVVLALPGRRRDVDDDLPEEPIVPAQAVEGEGRRARRLRAQVEAEAAAAIGATAEAVDADAPPPPADAPAPVPHQQNYGDWDQAAYAPAEYGSYGTYGGEQQQDARRPYDAGAYGQQPYPGTRTRPTPIRAARAARLPRAVSPSRAASTTRTATAIRPARPRPAVTTPPTARRTTRAGTARRTTPPSRTTPTAPAVSVPTGASSEAHHPVPVRGSRGARRRHRFRGGLRAGDTGAETAEPAARLPVERTSLLCPAPSASDLAETTYTSFTPVTEGAEEKGTATLTAAADGAGAEAGKGGEDAGSGKDGEDAKDGEESKDGEDAKDSKPVLRPGAPGTPVTGTASGADAPALTGTAEGATPPAGPCSRPPRSPPARAGDCWASTARLRTPSSGSRVPARRAAAPTTCT